MSCLYCIAFAMMHFGKEAARLIEGSREPLVAETPKRLATSRDIGCVGGPSVDSKLLGQSIDAFA